MLAFNFTGSGRANGPSTRKALAKMDEFSSSESRLPEASYKFFFRFEGKKTHEQSLCSPIFLPSKVIFS